MQRPSHYLHEGLSSSLWSMDAPLGVAPASEEDAALVPGRLQTAALSQPHLAPQGSPDDGAHAAEDGEREERDLEANVNGQGYAQVPADHGPLFAHGRSHDSHVANHSHDSTTHGHSHDSMHTHSHGAAATAPTGAGAHGHSHDSGAGSHGHSHDSGAGSHGHSHDSEASSSFRQLKALDFSIAKHKLQIAVTISLLVALIEIVGGVTSGSLAILADALHDLVDSWGLALGLLFLFLAKRQSSARYSYGFQRAEILGSLFSVALIWVIACSIIFEAGERMKRMLSKDPSLVPIQADIMLALSVFGLFSNVLILTVLGNHGHSHSSLGGGHSHSGENINVSTAVVHAIGHVLSDLGVVLAAGLILGLQSHVPMIDLVDPIFTIVFSLLGLWPTVRIITTSAKILLESVPPRVNVEDVVLALGKIRGVKSVHDVHVWSLSVDSPVMSAHLVVFKSTQTGSFRILKQAREAIWNIAGVRHVTIQIEPEGLPCMEVQEWDCHHYSEALPEADAEPTGDAKRPAKPEGGGVAEVPG